ncbi:MAG TPA: LamG domain-containing protein [Abditibacterium sp.]|jgi:hypothetical protein
MKISSAIAQFWLFLAVFSLGAVARAQEKPEEFVLRIEYKERRLEGTIKSINVARGLFTLDATAMSYPSGRMRDLDLPLSQLVLTRRDTFLHSRGSTTPDVKWENLRVGDLAVVIATFSETDQQWTANEIAVWNRLEGERYIFDSKAVPFAVPSGLVAAWKWENSAADMSGKFIGSQQFGASFAPGFVGRALAFDGKNDRFTVADAPEFELTKSLSIEGWIWVESCEKFGMILVRADMRSGPEPYGLYVKADGTISFRVMSDSKWAIVNAPIAFGRWVHIAATLDDATGVMRIYENGVVGAEAQTPVRASRAVLEEHDAGIGIGNYPARPRTKGTLTFHGLIDELSIYNRALTSAEVEGIFKAGSAGKIAVAPAVATPPAK